MPAYLADSLDFSLAWNRVLEDLTARRVFARHPFVSDLIDLDPAPWLSSVARAIRTGVYAGAPCRICYIPKPHGQVRPGGDISLVDQVVYSALVQQLRPRVQDALDWPSGHPDSAYVLRHQNDHREWFKSYFRHWKAFGHQSIDLIDGGATFVAVADIAGYYEQ